jgi:hypothetical protein
LLKTDLNVPSWGDHFAGLAEFVVIKDKKGQKNGKFFSLSLKSVVDKLEQDKSAPSSDKGKEEMKEDEQNNERRQPLRRYSADDAVPPSVPGNAPLPEASRWHDKSASTTLVQKVGALFFFFFVVCADNNGAKKKTGGRGCVHARCFDGGRMRVRLQNAEARFETRCKKRKEKLVKFGCVLTKSLRFW